MATNRVISESLADIRRRPGMWFFSTGGGGLRHLALEVIGNAIDQHLLGHATAVSVDLDDGWLTVTDDGAGIRIERDASGTPFLESVFTTRHDTPTADGDRTHVHATPSGLGVGLGPSCAVSARVEVETSRDGDRWSSAFERGVLVEPLQLIDSFERRGSKVRLLPDPQIFESETFESVHLEDHVRRLAFLTPRLRWRFNGEDISRPTGLHALVADTAGEIVPGSLAAFETTIDDVQIAFSVAITKRAAERRAHSLASWVNLRATLETGNDVKGMEAGLTKAFGARWRKLGSRVVGALHLLLVHPRFEGPTRAHLAVPELQPVIRDFVASELSKESDLRITWLEVLSRLDS